MQASQGVKNGDMAPSQGSDQSQGERLAQRDLAKGSKSFALAGKLLPDRVREDAAVCYAFCRLVDDAVDEVPAAEAPAAVARLHALVAALYEGRPQEDPRLRAFAALVARTRLPRHYVLELVEGMGMDARGVKYQTLDELRLYCHRVAGVVGLMMCHVLGVRDDRALKNAAHLGIAMQLTNICRDVAEDWTRGRLYLPADLTAHVAGPAQAGTSLPQAMGPALAPAVRTLLAEAEQLYRSGQKGLWALSARTALAIRVAAWVYRDIGRRLARRGFDVTRGRVVVPLRRKLWLACRAALSALAEVPSRLRVSPFSAPLTPIKAPTRIARYPDDILPAD